MGSSDTKVIIKLRHWEKRGQNANVSCQKFAAKVNMTYGMKEDIGNAIINAANEIIDGKLDDQFPLP